jgi:hypothetical protein
VQVDRVNRTRVPWQQLHALLLERHRAAGEIEGSRAVIDSSHVQAKKSAEPYPTLCRIYNSRPDRWRLLG